jgi:tetratricopeptide (TPR) repeat protein
MVQSKIEVFTAMLAEQPENAMIWYGLASEQYKLENWVEAAKALRQVVSLNPDYTALIRCWARRWLRMMTLPEPTGLERWHRGRGSYRRVEGRATYARLAGRALPAQ